MSPREIFALRDYLDPGLKGRTLSDARHSASLTDISDRTCLDGRLAELSGRSVLLAVSSQFLAALVMLEVDGIARRMLLCPPDLNADHLQALVEDAEIDAVVTDQPDRFATLGIPLVVTAGADLKAASRAQTERATEWLMLTSGTLGLPKIVGHTLEGLTGAIAADGPARGTRPIWATFYDIRRYGGLQIFLRAVIGGGSLVLSEPGEVACRPHCPLERKGGHAYVGHALALAQAVDERRSVGFFAALCPSLRRNRRPGRSRRSASGFPRSLDRPRLCLDRSRRRLCRQ